MNEELKAKALAWYDKHKAHVEKLKKSTTLAYEPSKEDMRSPALWKAAHWNWFQELTK